MEDPKLNKNVSKPISKIKSKGSNSSCARGFLICLVTIFILQQIQIYSQFFLTKVSNGFLLSEVSSGFLPLKDVSLSETAMEGNTWFMSSINDTYVSSESEHLHFPSYSSRGRILCIAGNNTRKGALNSYALVHPESLPPGARFLRGLTFISDTYYGYENIWHGLAATMPFVAWHERKGCVRPTRWVLFQRGEIRRNPAQWVRNLVQLTFREEMKIEKMVENPSCFEEAVVFRHNEGKMSNKRKIEVYEMVRCKAREFCKIKVREEKDDVKLVKVTLLLRNGSRSFKDEGGVIRVFEKECAKVKECRLKIVRSETLAFCDQVEQMSKTDVVASPHGAQLTNLAFMNKNSSVMEFFPKGWKELAGVGQYVFQWISAYSGMRHVGTWYDPKGDKCPYNENGKCMSFYKNRQIGHDEKFLSNWFARVLKEEKGRKLKIKMGELKREKEMKCKCG